MREAVAHEICAQGALQRLFADHLLQGVQESGGLAVGDFSVRGAIDVLVCKARQGIEIQSGTIAVALLGDIAFSEVPQIHRRFVFA